MENKMEDNRKQVAYEQAINAYQFHVQRYHTWVNFYAIFTGALFVALYNVMPLSGENVCSAGLEFSFLLTVMGWFTSICWLASIKGHYAWMLSWMRIVKQREKELFSEDKDIPPTYVYGKVMLSKGGDMRPNVMLPEFVSTQKVTVIFVWTVMLAWIVASYFWGRLGELRCCACLPPFVLSVLTFILWILIAYKTSSCYSSSYLDVETKA